MQTVFSELTSTARGMETTRIIGRVSSVRGLLLTATGLERAIGIGQRCRVLGAGGAVLGEVVGVDGAGSHILPFGTWDGIVAGDQVEVSPQGERVRPCDGWIGRVVDPLGRPLDRAGPLPEGRSPRAVRAGPPPAFDRRRVGARLETGIRAFDAFTPLCRGQRMGVFAGSGVGKSTLMAMLARNADVDVIVVGLIGERGREVQDFIQADLGPEGLARAVLVVATGDEPPLMRRQAAWTAMAVAEHFRDRGKQVLLLLDSITRFATAQREIGLSGGEPPTSRGYPPTVFAELPRLLERAGPGCDGQGDITALFTVLVEGSDMEEPVADSVRGITDGHVILDRRIAERGRYPAIDLQRSVSRMLPDCHGPDEFAILSAARRALGRYGDMEELVRIGAYRPGSDPETDAAIRFADPVAAYLGQRKGEATPPRETFADLYRLLVDAGIEVDLPPEAA
ncbi:FliI/YscN family ATPase [Oceanicola granulosus]|nr:FliI/YscN family ATPase [Oceanicola granulosus]